MGNTLGWNLTPEEQALCAAKEGDLEKLQELCHDRNMMEWQEKEKGYTPLIAASSNGHMNCVLWLVSHDIDIYKRDYRGNTPLHHACQKAQPSIVEFFLSLPNFSPYVMNARGESPLEVARKCYHESRECNEGDAELQRYSKCINLLEERCSVYHGYLFQRVDNLMSSVVGMASLQSWVSRYAIVLRTSSPSFLELALFQATPEDIERPAVPCSVLLIYISSNANAFLPPDASTWLSINKKSFGFKLPGTYKTDSVHHHQIQEHSFAAFDQEGFDSWLTFFESALPSMKDPILPEDYQYNTQSLGRPRHFPTVASVVPSAPSFEAIYDTDGIEIAQPFSIRPKRQQPPSPRSTDESCVVCFDAPQSTVCVPCGHNAICINCAQIIVESSHPRCPVCRQEVREVVKIYRCV